MPKHDPGKLMPMYDPGLVLALCILVSIVHISACWALNTGPKICLTVYRKCLNST